MAALKRRLTRAVRVGKLVIGGDAPVSVQSMTNTPTADVEATCAQIARLEQAGCELVRLAIESRRDLEALGAIRERTALPIIADIQYNHRLAVESLRLGADKVRINPGNIGAEKGYRAVIAAAARARKAMRIGINSGSVEAPLLARFGGPTPEAMVESALGAIRIAEEMGYRDLVISLKSSAVLATVEAYQRLARECDYPLHLGITEAGTVLTGAVRSAVGLGILLYEGLGDTVRISLTGPPETEIQVAWRLLGALGLRNRGVEVISCPTCGRTKIDMVSLAAQVEERLRHISAPLTVAVMGCYVNGPGEAREADVGLAGGAGKAAIFRKGRVVREVPEAECLAALLDEVERMLQE